MKLAALALLLVACGGAAKRHRLAPFAASLAAPPAAGNHQKLALAEMSIVDATKAKALAIHADGTIEADGHPVGVRVTADGKLVKVDGGDVGFELRPDGTIRGPTGALLDVTLGADGTITSGDKRMSLDDRGVLVGANPDAPPIRVEGATTRELKRTALFVLIALTSPIRSK